MRNGIIAAPVSLVGAAAIGRREMEQHRLRHGGTGHGGEIKLRPSVMAQ
ncbi:hypothetical protein NC651_026704 [Populus alba x Populus x berolinensis]|nr:hypothetical protein NC651_026704 [Populus alba x Populus x berolinensis]